MRAEIRTLLWLQWRLQISILRSRRADVWARLGRLLLALLMLIGIVPGFGLVAVGLGYALTRVSPAAGVELLLITNTLLALLWLLLPALYSSDLVERFDLGRIFAHPVSMGGLVTGSTLVSFFSPLGLGSLLLLMGEAVGLAWHRPLALPLILAGLAGTLVMLVLLGRLMEDLFDAVAGDRRLRGLLIFLLTAPFLVLLVGNYYVQIVVSDDAMRQGIVSRLLPNMPSLDGMGFGKGFDTLLRYAALSRVLGWLPTGWSSAGAGSAVLGNLPAGIAQLALGFLLVLGEFRLHGRVLRRLIQGGSIRLATQRVGRSGLEFDLPGPKDFWTLVAKDWIYLKRSPLTKMVVLGTPLLVVALGFAAWQVVQVLPAESGINEVLPYIAGGLLLVSVNLAMCNFTANYFGAVDREGLPLLVLAPVNRRFVLLSQALVTLAFTLVQLLVILLLVAAITGRWAVLPWGLAAGLALHVSTLPAYMLVGILTPYRARMTFSSSSSQGNMWMVLAWLITSIPALLLAMVPALLYPTLMIPALVVAVLYAVALYAITLRPLANLLDRHAYRIVEVVGTGAE